jgi:hypothetical protein
MHIRAAILQIQRTTRKVHLAIFCTFPKIMEDVRLSPYGCFGRSGEVDAAEEERASVVVHELGLDGVDVTWREGLAGGRGGSGDLWHCRMPLITSPLAGYMH